MGGFEPPPLAAEASARRFSLAKNQSKPPRSAHLMIQPSLAIRFKLHKIPTRKAPKKKMKIAKKEKNERLKDSKNKRKGTKDSSTNGSNEQTNNVKD
jgi:hypothetical protein